VCAERITTPLKQHVQMQDICIGCIRELRNHPRVGPQVPIIVAMEAQGSEASFLAPTFETIDNDVIVMREFKNEGSFGVPKNGNVLVGLVGTTQALLMRNLVSIPNDAIAFSSTHAKSTTTMRDHREALAKQFGAFRVDSYTGSINGKAGGGNDDMLIAFMMALYWMTRFCSRNLDIYIAFRERYGNDIWFSAMAHNLCMKDDIQRKGEIAVLDKKPNLT
jgi:hypothetical protein